MPWKRRRHARRQKPGQLLHAREASEDITQGVELAADVGGDHVKRVNNLVEPYDTGQVLQPHAAAAPAESREGHAGVVDAEACDRVAEQVALLHRAVRDCEELLGLDVFLLHDGRG